MQCKKEVQSTKFSAFITEHGQMKELQKLFQYECFIVVIITLLKSKYKLEAYHKNRILSMKSVVSKMHELMSLNGHTFFLIF